MEAKFDSSVSDHFEVKFGKMLDLNFTFRSKVKGAGMAFNFGFGNKVLFGKVCPARHDHSCKATISYFWVYGRGILL